MALTNYQYTSLINTIFLVTEGELERLFIRASCYNRDPCPLALALLQGVWNLSDLTRDLKEITIETSFPVSFDSGLDERGSRRFIMVNDEQVPELRGNAFQCLRVIKDITEFTGARLNTLIFSSELIISLEDEDGPIDPQDPRLGHLRQLFREIKLSCDSLKSLDVKVDVKTVPMKGLDLVFSCPILSTLKLGIVSRLEDAENPENFELEFPKDPSSPSRLVSLDLLFEKAELNWDSPSLLARIGTRLTSFNLSCGKEGEQSTIPITSLPSILDSNPSLETIKFQHLSVTESESSSPTPTKLFLPNLNSIQLHSVHLLVTICSK